MDESSSVKKLCVDCKYHKLEDRSETRNILIAENDPLAVLMTDKHWCHHPSYQTLDVVTGEIKANEKECSRQRTDLYFCGVNGKLWEPKDE